MNINKSTVAGVFLYLLALQTSFAQNLVVDGSFSTSGTNWNFFPPAVAVEKYNLETSYGGASATNIVAEVDYGANLRQTIAVTPGQTYSFGFKRTRRTLGAPNPVSINVKIYNGASIFLDANISSTNTVWNWTCETFSFTPTTNTVTLDVANMTASMLTLGTIVDDLTIVKSTHNLTQSGSTCLGGTTTLSTPIYPGDPNNQYTNFSWSGPAGLIVNTGNTLTLSNLQFADAGTYTCTMTVNGCIQVTASYTLAINSPVIAVSSSAPGNAICSGGSTTLTASGASTYTWSPSTGLSATTGSSVTANPVSTTTYTVTGTNGCTGTGTLTLIVNNPTTSTAFLTKCPSQLPFIWNGITIPSGATSNPVYTTYTTTNAAGCDSIVTLNLTVSPNVTSTAFLTKCPGQLPTTWNGITIPSGATSNPVILHIPQQTLLVVTAWLP